MTITKRLVIMLSVALLALIFVGSFGLWRLNQAQQRFDYVQVNIIPSIAELTAAKDDLGNLRRMNYRYLIITDSAGRVSIKQAMTVKDESIGKHLAVYERDDISDDTDRKLLETDKADIAVYRTVWNDFAQKISTGDQDGAKAMLFEGGALLKAAQDLADALDRHVEYNNKLSNDLRTENNSAYAQAFWLLAIATLAALVLASGMGVQLYRLITSGLNSIQQTLQHVSQSLDLTNTAKVERMDEIGLTATAFNTLLTRVAEVVSEVRLSAGSVGVASKQIASGNIDLSARTEEQAASLEETAASMEELTTTVTQNTESARQASALAGNALEISSKGSQVVERMVETMGEITASSTKIAEITALIEGVAFQTNILALNAAVEAARAGEQGRGFAVVASEVRSLAQRSSSAAKEIKDLITTSVAAVQVGSTQAEEVGRTTAEALKAVKQVADIIGEIASASEEQGRGIEQVNQAVSQMDQVTQQNAALVEEAAAAAQSLEEQARKMNEMMSVFTVSGGAVANHHAPTPTPAPVPAARKPADKKPQKASAPKEVSQRVTRAAAVAAPKTADHGAEDWETF